jgi:hypothetical protein
MRGGAGKEIGAGGNAGANSEPSPLPGGTRPKFYRAAIGVASEGGAMFMASSRMPIWPNTS